MSLTLTIAGNSKSKRDARAIGPEFANNLRRGEYAAEVVEKGPDLRANHLSLELDRPNRTSSEYTGATTTRTSRKPTFSKSVRSLFASCVDARCEGETSIASRKTTKREISLNIDVSRSNGQRTDESPKVLVSAEDLKAANEISTLGTSTESCATFRTNLHEDEQLSPCISGEHRHWPLACVYILNFA